MNSWNSFQGFDETAENADQAASASAEGTSRIRIMVIVGMVKLSGLGLMKRETVGVRLKGVRQQASKRSQSERMETADDNDGEQRMFQLEQLAAHQFVAPYEMKSSFPSTNFPPGHSLGQGPGSLAQSSISASEANFVGRQVVRRCAAPLDVLGVGEGASDGDSVFAGITLDGKSPNRPGAKTDSGFAQNISEATFSRIVALEKPAQSLTSLFEQERRRIHTS